LQSPPVCNLLSRKKAASGEADGQFREQSRPTLVGGLGVGRSLPPEVRQSSLTQRVKTMTTIKCPHCGHVFSSKPETQPYKGYLAPYLDEIKEMFAAGAKDTEIARHVMRRMGRDPNRDWSERQRFASSIGGLRKRHTFSTSRPLDSHVREWRVYEMAQMRAAGATFKTIGARFGVSVNRARGIVHAEQQRQRTLT
jgi:hypothetical protein